MTVSFAADVERPRLPTTWAKENGELYGLACRRDMAGEAGLETIPQDSPHQARPKGRSPGRIEVEINPDPHPRDNQIAKAPGRATAAGPQARAPPNPGP